MGSRYTVHAMARGYSTKRAKTVYSGLAPASNHYKAECRDVTASL